MHLGSIIDEQGGSDADVKARIGKARVAFLPIEQDMWNSKQLSTNIKVRIFNTNVKAVLLYGTQLSTNIKVRIFNTNVKAVLLYGAENLENYSNHHQEDDAAVVAAAADDDDDDW
ncbi:unnamed protein product [Schistosoma mattheei]|uniref:Uncharacterized protein n=1 Tax=Schistosoma mattheei TaxID=31246 RepID=A0A183Q4W1_9TREM|nr:unnamed protein product [Schistosoma mattheei]